MPSTPRSSHYADRLIHAIRAKESSVCVGLDPVVDRLPAEFLRQVENDVPENGPLEAGARAISSFCRRVCDVTVEHAPVFKVQMAYFEIFGPAGVRAAAEVAAHARSLGALVIGDLKRGDIGSTASAFATAYFGSTELAGTREHAFEWDAITVNPYMGLDAIEPFLPHCGTGTEADPGRGLYALVRTSNPSSRDLQDLEVEGRPLYTRVAELVDGWGSDRVGAEGFSSVGAVVGATFPAELETCRTAMPRTPFLVPGVGAQGGRPEDVHAALGEDGTGAVVNSSRGILYAFDGNEGSWEAAVEAAALELKTRLRGAKTV